MRETSQLNDANEGITAIRVFEDRSWMKFEWERNLSITKYQNRFVSSFTKIKPSNEMLKRYGKNVYGFKNDKIASLISPIGFLNNQPYFEIVSAYDVSYDVVGFREEINFMSEILDQLNIDESEKTSLLNDLVKRFDLSIKDKEWASEHERRYEIWINPYAEAYGWKVENGFLKISSTLFSLPDFINPENVMKGAIAKERGSKLRSLATRRYLFCNDCLQADFDFNCNETCSICGSTNTTIVEPTKKPPFATKNG